MEFLYSKEKGAGAELSVKKIYSIPSTVVIIMFNQPEIRFGWLIDIIGWILAIGVSIVLYYYIRGIAK
jgi:hypothetical protein